MMKGCKFEFSFRGYVIFEKDFEKNGYKASIFKFNSGRQVLTIFVSDASVLGKLKAASAQEEMIDVFGSIEEQGSALRLIPVSVSRVTK